MFVGSLYTSAADHAPVLPQVFAAPGTPERLTMNDRYFFRSLLDRMIKGGFRLAGEGTASFDTALLCMPCCCPAHACQGLTSTGCLQMWGNRRPARSRQSFRNGYIS